jgi:hypothetical protein
MSETDEAMLAEWIAADPKIGVDMIRGLRAENERISAAWAEVIQREQRTDNAAFYDVQEALAEVARLRERIEAICEQAEQRGVAALPVGMKLNGCVPLESAIYPSVLRAALTDPSEVSS